MSWHLFGTILTGYGAAANNRGENEGNITTLQKLLWKGEVHTTVSAEAIRWALRYHWQIKDSNGHSIVNRYWDDEKNDNILRGSFDSEAYIDDDVLGYMRAEGAKEEGSDQPKAKPDKSKPKAEKPKGTTTARRGVLEVTRAVSTTPFVGDITFNAASGQKGRTSLYGTEVHATRYQYGFALTPARLAVPARVIDVLDGLVALGEVAGNHSRFLYDFSPESIVLRWTHDFSPRLLYCFEESEEGTISVPSLIRRVETGDIPANELWVAGQVATTEDGARLKQLGVQVNLGVRATAEQVKKRITEDLELGALAGAAR